MATIDELNFEVILNDKDFNKRINDDIALAGKLNIELSKLASLKLPTLQQVINPSDVTSLKEADNVLKSILASLQNVPGKAVNIKASVSSVNSSLRESADYLRDIERLTGVAFGVVGVRQFLSSLVDITGQFEVQQMALRSMIGDANKADQIFADLRQNALESPYTFQDLSKYAKQLAAFNIDADQIVETEKRLADVAAGLGVDMGRIILAYGQVKAAGVLKGTELRQFTEAGVPLLQSLADQIERTTGKTINLAQVFDMISKKQIPFEMVEQAFKDMTSEGGKFYNMQEVLVETLQGKIGKLRDTWQQAVYDLGQANSGALKGAVDMATRLVSHLDEIGSVLKIVIGSMGVYYGALLLAASGEKLLESIQAVKALISLATGAKAASSALVFLGGAAKATALSLGLISAIGIAVYELTKHIKKLRDEQSAFDKAAAQATTSISQESSELEKLAKVAKNEANSMKDRQDAIDVINAKYGEYLNKLGIEKVSVDNLASSYDALKNAIANKYLEQLKEQTVGAKQTNLNDATTELNKFNADLIRGARVNGRQYNALGIGQIQGEIENFIRNHPLFDADALMGVGNGVDRKNSILGIYDKYGITVKDLNGLLKVVQGYVNAGNELKSAEKNFNDFAKGYGDALGLIHEANEKEDEKDSSWSPTTKEKTQAQRNIEDRIKVLQKYKDSYNKLKSEFTTGNDLVDNSLMSAILSRIYGEDFHVENLDALITEQADKLAKFGEDAKNQAENIKASLAKDEVGDFIEQTKEFRKYREETDKLFSKSYNDNDVVGKMLTDYKNKIGEIEAKYNSLSQKAKKVYGEESEYLDEEIKKLDEWREATEKYEKAQLTEKAKKTAKDIFDNAMTGYDLSDWSKKSLSDILAIKDAIEGVTIPDDIKEALKEYPDILDIIEKELTSIKNKTNDKTVDPQVAAKWVKYAKQIASYISKAGDSLKKWADATGNVQLGDLANDLSSIGQNLNAAAEGYQASGSWIGAVIGGVTDIITQVVDRASEAEAKLAQMRKTISGIRAEAESTRFSNLLSDGVDTLFGDNFVRRLRNATKGLEDVKKALDELDKQYAANRSNANTFLGRLMSSPMGEDTRIHTSHKGGFLGIGKKDEFETIKNLAKDFGMELRDMYGNLNPQLLDKIISTYGDLNANLIEWLQSAKTYSEEYAKAMETIEDSTREVFDSLSSDLADTFIDNYLRMGNAVDDLSGTFADLGDAMLRSFLQSYILDEILQKYQEEAKSALVKYSTGQMTPDDYASWLSGFVENVKRESETLAPAINGMIEAFKDRGLMNVDEDTANSLGSGIKSITEDTAGLLASYINAIRADVSVMRGLQQSGWQNVSAILGFLQSPTLNDHIARTDANTYDIAQSNSRILAELQSVIRSGSNGGMVVMAEIG